MHDPTGRRPGARRLSDRLVAALLAGALTAAGAGCAGGPAAAGGPVLARTAPAEPLVSGRLAFSWQRAGDGATVAELVFAPGGARLAAIGFDGRVRLWETVGGRALGELPAPPVLPTTRPPQPGRTAWTPRVAFSPDGAVLAAGDRDGAVRLWDAVEARLLRTLPADCSDPEACARRDEPPVESLAFAPDGHLLAVGLADGAVRLWDPASGDTPRVLPSRSSPVRSVAFAPDGTRLAAGDWTGTVRLWDTAGWRPLPALAGEAPALALAFAPGDRLLAVGSRSGAALWDAATGRRRGELTHRPGVQQLAFLGDGTTLATAAGDGSLALWRTATGEALDRWRGDETAAIVALDPSGAWLAAAPIAQDGAVAVWRRP